MTTRRCTICGRECWKADRARWSRHVYGLVSEPRCSQECALKPVVDVETQRTLERMGDIVVAYRLEHGLAVTTEGGRVTISGGLPPK